MSAPFDIDSPGNSKASRRETAPSFLSVPHLTTDAKITILRTSKDSSVMHPEQSKTVIFQPAPQNSVLPVSFRFPGNPALHRKTQAIRRRLSERAFPSGHGGRASSPRLAAFRPPPIDLGGIAPPSTAKPLAIPTPPMMLPSPDEPRLPGPSSSAFTGTETTTQKKKEQSPFIVCPDEIDRLQNSGAPASASPGYVEELSLNPFTATYRNFSESVLQEIVAFLEAAGREIEHFAYRALEKMLSEIRVDESSNSSFSGNSVRGGNDSSTSLSKPNLEINYFNMNPLAYAPDRGNSDPVSFEKQDSRGQSGCDSGPSTNFEMLLGDKSNDSDGSVSDRQQFLEGVGVREGKEFPLSYANNYFQYSKDWLEEFPIPSMVNEAKVAATTEAPVFFAGMLMDPVSENFLFGGAAFYEEARVLKVFPPNRMDGDNSKSSPVSSKNSSGFGATKDVQRILLREYISLSRDHDGFIVQTFSILNPEAKVSLRRNQLISPATTLSLMRELQPGALTRAFALQTVRTIKSVKGEASVENMDAFVSIPHVFADSKRSESFFRTAVFLNNISKRYNSSLSSKESERGQQNSSSLWLKRRFRKENASSVDQYPFLSDDNSMRPQVESEMKQNAPLYSKLIDHIKAYLLFYKDTYSFFAMVQIFLKSVRCLQRFFKRTIAKKKRAVARMMRLWRHLEAECRLKLLHFSPPKSSVERIDMIAANLLEPLMMTTKEYKYGLIEDMWDERRQACRKWLNDLNTEKCLRQQCVSLVAPQNRNSYPRFPSENIRNTGSLEAVTETLSKVFAEVSKNDGATDNFLRSPTHSPFVNSTKSSSFMFEPRESLLSLKENRIADEMHRLYGWYIEPEKLLYESHSRLLQSIRDSVLSIDEVHLEMQKMSVDRVERRGGVSNFTLPI